MAQFARPSSDISAGSWSSTPLYSKIDEVDSSTTDSISGPSRASSTAQLGLSAVVDPAKSTGHILHVTAYETTGITLDIELRMGAGNTLIKTWRPALTGSWATYDLTLTGTEADSITDYSTLKVYFVQTYVTGTGTRKAYVAWFCLEVPGVDVKTSKAAYLKGGDSSKTNKASYLKGTSTGKASKAAYLKSTAKRPTITWLYVDVPAGAFGTPADSSTTAYLKGQSTAKANRSVYLKGLDTSKDSQTAYLKGKDTAKANKGAYQKGLSTGASSHPAYIRGQDSSEVSRAAYLKGQVFLKSSTTVYTRGQTSGKGNTPAFTRGSSTGKSSTTVFLVGKSTSKTSQPAYIQGSVNAKTSCSAFLRGGAQGKGNVSSFTAGKSTVRGSTTAYLRGQSNARYSAFPNIPVLDDFNRADGTPLGPLWHDWNGQPQGFYIEDQQAASYGDTYGNVVLNDPLTVNELEGYITLVDRVIVEFETRVFICYARPTETGYSRYYQVEVYPHANDLHVALSRASRPTGYWVYTTTNLTFPKRIGFRHRDNLFTLYIDNGDGIWNEVYTEVIPGILSGYVRLIGYYVTLDDFAIGEPTTHQGQAAFLQGQASGSSSQPVYLHGKDTANGTQPAVLHGADTLSHVLAGYLLGGLDQRGSQPVYLHGLSTNKSTLPAFLEGGVGTGRSTHVAYLAGTDSGQTSQTAYTRGQLASQTQQVTYLAGQDNLASSVPSYLKGQDYDTTAQACFLSGQMDGKAVLSAYLRSDGECTTTLPAFTAGIEGQASAAQVVYLQGLDTSSSHISALLTGSNSLSTSTGAYLQGFDTNRSVLPAYIRGLDTSSTSWPVYIKGGSQVQDSHPCFVDCWGQIQLPDTDGITNSWVNEEGGVSLFSSLADDSDDTYATIEHAGVGDYFDIDLEDFDILEEGVAYYEWSARRLAGSQVIVMECQLWCGEDLIAVDSRLLSDTTQTFRRTLTLAEKNSIASTIDLRLRFIVTGVS